MTTTDNTVTATKKVTTKKPVTKKATTDKTVNAELPQPIVIKIGTHKVTLQSKITTLKNVKTVITSFFVLYGLDKKSTIITLPNGANLKFADLNTVKRFADVLFPAQMFDGLQTDANDIFKANLLEIQKVLYSLPIDWDLVGTKDGSKMLTLYKTANKKAIETLKVSAETTLIG